ncbi:MAG: sirohydrochlorin cobaltochelatase, partial [Clostridia bacterium]|nr:sirohydrochlorin cobaltochelatase [Clostridia bacterium]
MDRLGAAAADAIRPVIVAVSFGSRYTDRREAAIGALEEDLRAAYPGYEVRRAFTSQSVIDSVKRTEGVKIDNVAEAMERMACDGVKKAVVQPTHVTNGRDDEGMVSVVSAYAGRFDL